MQFLKNHWFKILLVKVVIITAVLLWWSNPPPSFDPVLNAKQTYDARDGNNDTVFNGIKMPVGYCSVNTSAELMNILLDKNGGYISNDHTIGYMLDNMPNWEFGILTAVRDHQQWLRNHASRSQSQSTENRNLAKSEPNIAFDNNSWLFPSTEGLYKKSREGTYAYLDELGDYNDTHGNFYARADNLAVYLLTIAKRLGSLSQRLSYSTPRNVINTNIDTDTVDGIDEKGAVSSKQESLTSRHKTGWFKIDDIVYEARGYSYADLHFLKAIRHDFKTVLKKKAAMATLDNIINELEVTQNTIWSPVILTGSGFSFTANHAIVISSYISRANAGVENLINLLNNG